MLTFENMHGKEVVDWFFCGNLIMEFYFGIGWRDRFQIEIPWDNQKFIFTVPFVTSLVYIKFSIMSPKYLLFVIAKFLISQLLLFVLPSLSFFLFLF